MAPFPHDPVAVSRCTPIKSEWTDVVDNIDLGEMTLAQAIDYRLTSQLANRQLTTWAQFELLAGTLAPTIKAIAEARIKAGIKAGDDKQVHTNKMLARYLRCSESTVTHCQRILAKCKDEAVLLALRQGTETINAVYAKHRPAKIGNHGTPVQKADPIVLSAGSREIDGNAEAVAEALPKAMRKLAGNIPAGERDKWRFVVSVTLRKATQDELKAEQADEPTKATRLPAGAPRTVTPLSRDEASRRGLGFFNTNLQAGGRPKANGKARTGRSAIRGASKGGRAKVRA